MEGLAAFTLGLADSIQAFGPASSASILAFIRSSGAGDLCCITASSVMAFS